MFRPAAIACGSDLLVAIPTWKPIVTCAKTIVEKHFGEAEINEVGRPGPAQKSKWKIFIDFSFARPKSDFI